MKNLIIIALLIIIAPSCQEQPVNNTDTDKKETVENNLPKPATKTAAHVNIPGSQLFIIPPTGFVENKTTMQLKKDSVPAGSSRIQY